MSSKQVWRLIPLLETSGNVQMAIDKWLIGQHQLGKQPPCLRFYTWSPPAISLGYHQRQYPEFWQNLTWQGQKLDLVRRPTGGRAVLHQGDLSYAVVTSGLVGSRLQVYGQICEFLIQGWRSLNVNLHYGQAGRDYIRNPNCFGTATGADLVLANGSKLIGSAQLRQGEAVLQHGSIQLKPDPDLFKLVFGKDSIIPVELIKNLDQQAIIDALINSACECFNIQLDIQPLSDSEWEEII
ncbi:biotin/lipoate A/B protein ligase family protein [Cronbergia sp. UHCC 0137]|uniref:lipoate--protein ligase family protein n=1 Tax=Cronbergia sp. UHCC 0137 TaxID=3110239 RepID=UPI002B207411|nr:biotin/lipoate A/B protein ligase family protein [Cronbergia sp. UHCC 0137]MEA5618302.1 biotin/lipoate A/B protein ligase family protein [Cronbergia sp. UHCC 0137]